MNIENKLDGSTAYKVIDADNMVVLQIFHEEHRQTVINYWKGKYGSVSEDRDRDIICFEEPENDDYKSEEY
jgi:hypothetical protein